MARRRVAAKFVRDLGFRSKLELIVTEQLTNAGMPFEYEGDLNLVRFTVPQSNGRYLCDYLLGNGIMIESKGYLTQQNRKKHLLIKKQFPQLDIRFLFMRPNNTISKKSKTTYSMWCDKNGFLWCDKVIPESWLNERKPKKELDLIIKTLKGFKKK